MRSKLSWLALSSAVLLSACGGDTSPQTVGGVAPPSGSTPTPTPTTPTSTHSFLTPTEVKTYEGIGAVQHFEYYTDSNNAPDPAPGQERQEGRQRGQLYGADANTVRNSGITITYNPRDAIFDMTIARPAGIVTISNFRFQDPAHRTDFGGAREPQASVPNLNAGTDHRIQYLQAGGSVGSRLSPTDDFADDGWTTLESDYAVGAKGFQYSVSTFFYQKNTATAGTKYVTYAGFVRNGVTTTLEEPDALTVPFLRQSYNFDRGAFVFGERTGNGAVPTSGSATFTGDMIATMVYNPNFDTNDNYPTYFQWIQGSHSTVINFGSFKVDSTFTGIVGDIARDAYTSGHHTLPAGSTFTATSTATIDLINKGGFTGQFTSATLGGTAVNIAGSSIDGAFFGPNGQEIGGGFRIVGGTPDERIDILGAFTGARPPAP